VSSTLPYLKAGRLRALGVTSTKRIAALPDTPAIAESLSGYEVTTWYGLLTTTGTPAASVARLHRETVKAAENTDVRARLAAAGVEAETRGPGDFSSMIRAETLKWGKLIQAAGVKTQ